jgi:hypothetical protein
MAEALGNVGRKLLAILVLVVAAFVLFKILAGFVLAIAGILVVIVAVVAVIWAFGVLR